MSGKFRQPWHNAGSRTFIVVGAVLALAISIFLLFHFACCRRPAENSVEDIANWVRVNRTILCAHAEAVRRGQVHRNENRVTYPVPHTSEGVLKVIAVTEDDNGNVYYVLSNSFVTFNRGVILRKRDCPFLGDQCEPRITLTRHLFENWWYYEAD